MVQTPPLLAGRSRGLGFLTALGYNKVMQIKRYANRKLYDLDARRYITLEEIGQAVQRGEEVRVSDHASGADLTAVTLLQVIFEQQKRLGALIPRTVLTRVLQSRQGLLNNARESLLAFSDPNRHVEDEIRRRLMILGERGLLTSQEIERLSNLLLSPDLRPGALPPQEDPVRPEEVEDLLDQVSRLETELARLEQDA